jgi:putative transposase
LEPGPAVDGFGQDQRWTLARVLGLISRCFYTRQTLRGTANVLHRFGFSLRGPEHRAVERDEQAIRDVTAGGVAGGTR